MSDLQRAIEDAIMFHELQLRSMQDGIDKDFAPSATRWYRDAKGYTKTAIAALRDVQARQKGCERCLHFPLDDGSYDDNLYCFSCGRQIFKKRPTPEQSSEVEKGGGE